MPWKECSVMDERLRFVARLLEGEGMSEVCREFGISRKTGYKIFDRYKDRGLEALSDRSRRPVRYANQLPPQIESLITVCKREKPHWGARKIRELLVRKLDGDFRVPAKSTIHAVLCRHDLVKPMGRPRRRATGTPLSGGDAPNALWCADFKGEFKLGDARYCYPLTVTDHASRFLLLCEALESTREDPAITAFEQLFRVRGLALIGTAIAGPFEDSQIAYRRDDYAEALRLWGNLTDPRAQFSIGQMYYIGQGVLRDNAKADAWFLKAADQGFAYAQFDLGAAYEDGRAAGLCAGPHVFQLGFAACNKCRCRPSPNGG